MLFRLSKEEREYFLASLRSMTITNQYKAAKSATYGGTQVGDIYGADEKEQKASTEYKTVYESENSQSVDYGKTIKYKGDAVYETFWHEIEVENRRETNLVVESSQ